MPLSKNNPDRKSLFFVGYPVITVIPSLNGCSKQYHVLHWHIINHPSRQPKKPGAMCNINIYKHHPQMIFPHKDT
jgi:hypothetical protein